MSVAEAHAPFTEDSTSRTVQTKRWKLHYNEVGAGSPIILLHGTGPGATGWSNFHQNMAVLSANHRVIALDFPGWGGSEVFDCAGEPRNAANAEAVKLLMDELGLEKAGLVGNSMGGAATLEFMARYPDRISHAITMGSGLFGVPNMFTPGGPSQGIRVIFETYMNPTPENFRRLVEIMVYDASFVTDELTQQRSAGALAQREHLTNWLKGGPLGQGGMFAGIEELMGKLAVSQVPTLMIHGRDDKTVPMEVTLKTASLIPNSRAVILNRCGHWAQVEHADEFNSLVLGFVDRKPASAAKGGFGG